MIISISVHDVNSVDALGVGFTKKNKTLTTKIGHKYTELFVTYDQSKS